jgi:hypothetical protein
MRPRLIVVATALFGSAACSLLVSTSDLSDGQRGADPDAAPSDALADSPAPTSDAGSDGEAGSCPPGGFCDDFDQAELGATWDTKVIESGSAVSLDKVDFKSGPSSFHARSGLRSVASASAALVKVFPGVPKSVRCSFWLRVNNVSWDPQAPIDFFQIRATAPGGNDYELRLGTRGAVTGVREDIDFPDGGCGCPRTSSDTEAIPVGTWVRVQVDTNLSAVSVSYDGRTVLSTTFPGVAYTSLSLFLGLESFSDKVFGDVLYDDLVCEVRN